MKTKQYDSEPIVVRYGGWSNPFYILPGSGLLFFFLKFQSIPKDALWWIVLVLIICVVACLIYARRTIEFNDDGIRVNGAAVIPWGKIDEVVFFRGGEGPDFYKFRYISYDGKYRYLNITNDMTNWQEAVNLAHKKLPGKFGDKFSAKPKNPSPVSSDASSDVYSYIFSDISANGASNGSSNISSPVSSDISSDVSSYVYTGKEIVIRSMPITDAIVFYIFTCFMWFTTAGLLLLDTIGLELLILSLVLPLTFYWPIYMLLNKKVIFNNNGIIAKRNKPPIRWDDIYAVDIEHGAYIFRYSAPDWEDRSIRLPFNMSNMRKGIELAKKKRPDLFDEG